MSAIDFDARLVDILDALALAPGARDAISAGARAHAVMLLRVIAADAALRPEYYVRAAHDAGYRGEGLDEVRPFVVGDRVRVVRLAEGDSVHGVGSEGVVIADDRSEDLPFRVEFAAAEGVWPFDWFGIGEIERVVVT
jgi:hypothetical protein